MSHFSVMVLTSSRPTQEDLGRILMPWHEYECTGHEEYLQDVDKTEEVAAEFAKPRPTVILSDGTAHSRWDDRFWGQGEFTLPAGAREEELPAEEAVRLGVGYLTMEECAREYCGAEPRRVGEVTRFCRRTNPNHKWDWWQVGGRWSGMLEPHYDPDKDPANRETCWLCAGTGKRRDMEVANGCNGCAGKGIRTKWPTEWKSIGNQARLGDIPLEALRNIAEHRALQAWDRHQAIVAGRPIPAWEPDKISEGEWEEARQRFNSDPVVVDLQEKDPDVVWDIVGVLDQLRLTRAEVAAQARRRAVQTFALVHDGRWHQRGEMGWWGVVHNAKEPDRWDEEFSALLDRLPPDTWVTIVDCHT